VDPICHTLVGAAVGESGLKRRTGLGMATLLVAANLPDIDVLAYLDGPTTALWFRRGLTHGVVAWVALPLLLTGAMLLADRLLRRRRGGAAAVPGQLFLLSVIGVATHPVLDFLNVYGIRLLMPFSSRWFYGDTLFIVDPWIWLVLGIGIVAARRRARRSEMDARRSGIPARVALVLVSGYILLMGMAGVLTRRTAEQTAVIRAGSGEVRVMVAPEPANPFRRRVLAEVGDEYFAGALVWPGAGRIDLQPLGFGPEPSFYAVAATRGPEARKFLGWARFPYFVADTAAGTVVIADARYTLRPGGSWASVRVELGRSP
jgi:inner membrane protein